MRNVCDSCDFSKDKGEYIYCRKYGVPIWSPRIHCIGWEKDKERRNDVNQIWNPDDEIWQPQDRSGWPQV